MDLSKFRLYKQGSGDMICVDMDDGLRTVVVMRMKGKLRCVYYDSTDFKVKNGHRERDSALVSSDMRLMPC